MAHHFFLPIAIATTMVVIFLFMSPTTAATSAVVDTDGNPLEVGSQYYVLTAGTRGAGRGGLTYMSKPLGFLCPFYVGQHGFWMERGFPISIFPANQTQTQISEGDDVNIAFRIPAYCRSPGFWRITLDNENKIPYVSTDGWTENSGSKFSASWFKFEKSFSDRDYKIVYCSEEQPEPEDMNSNIIKGGKKEICQQLDATLPGPFDVSFLSLVPINYPLPFFGFIFQKAFTPTPTAITTTTSDSM